MMITKFHYTYARNEGNTIERIENAFYKINESIIKSTKVSSIRKIKSYTMKIKNIEKSKYGFDKICFSRAYAISKDSGAVSTKGAMLMTQSC